MLKLPQVLRGIMSCWMSDLQETAHLRPHTGDMNPWCPSDVRRGVNIGS